jgi:hypothetical protein
MARFGQASIGSPECSMRSASSHTTPAQAAPRVPLLQRRITNLTLPVPRIAIFIIYFYYLFSMSILSVWICEAFYNHC